jgi:hypothetical protein
MIRADAGDGQRDLHPADDARPDPPVPLGGDPYLWPASGTISVLGLAVNACDCTSSSWTTLAVSKETRDFSDPGGVVVRDRDWRALREFWQGVLRTRKRRLDREVKWHGVGEGEVPDSLSDAVFATLAVAPITCFVTVTDLTAGLIVVDSRFREDDAGSDVSSATSRRKARPT